MKYSIYKLRFSTGVHFGNGMLNDSDYIFPADALFSAMFIEALKMGTADEFLDHARSGRICFSDLLPYVGDHYLVPKPLLPVESDEKGNSREKKKMKNLRFLPVESLDSYLKGKWNPDQNLMEQIGMYDHQTMAAVRRDEDTLPYHVGVFRFFENSGLYLVIAYSDEDALNMTTELLDALQYTGIGGKRSAGLGKFEIRIGSKIDPLLDRINSDSQYHMTLSSSLPKEAELEMVLEDAYYILQKKAGFVVSATYSETFAKKKDMYVFSAGSCFGRKFEGDIYDVSDNGAHPVYRYAKPIFMGV